MTYRVTVLPRAREQFFAIAEWWAENRSIEQAGRWLEGFISEIETLAIDPERFPLAPEPALHVWSREKEDTSRSVRNSS